MATNLATYLLSQLLVRSSEVPAANWAGGGNYAGSNAPGIGINTGNADPKAEDWPRIEHTSEFRSMHIGDTDRVVRAIDGDDINDYLAFVEADAETAPDAVLDVTTGAVNRTGVTVAAGAWVWGVIPVS